MTYLKANVPEEAAVLDQSNTLSIKEIYLFPEIIQTNYLCPLR